jgi:uncharacterized Tic20 family protein
MEESKEKILAVVSHLGGLIPCCFLPVVIPFVIWITKGEESPFVNRQAKEALNFQISLSIYFACCWLLVFTILGIPIAFIAFIVFIIMNFICSIIGAVKTSQGSIYNYPLNLRLIK